MTQGKRSVLVLMGGPDAERPVSLQSGRAVAEALRRCGRFIVYEKIIDLPTETDVASMPGDVVFPVLHGRWGEGGGLQTILERVGRPYVGSAPGPAALAMDKMKTKALLRLFDVASPDAIELNPSSPCTLGPPLVLKPVDDGSSVDIRICHTEAEVSDARAALHPQRDRLMAEQYIAGRELTVGLVCGRLLPIIEIRPAVTFYDYEAKYDRADTVYIIDPPLPANVREKALRDSMVAFEQIGCRDLARVDFRLDAQDRLWFLEINTMPGFTSHSLVPMAARHTGLDMPDLCAELVDAAVARSGHGIAQRLTA